MTPAPECIFTAERIAARVRELAAAIRERLGGRPATVLGILNGAALFAADLVRAVGAGAELSFIQARSYGKRTVSSGQVETGPLERELLEGRTVVVADTILDTGLTLQSVVARAAGCGAATILTCVLLDKRARRTVEIQPDFAGFEVPDRFLVGYGLDHAGRYRALPYVGVLKQRANV